MPAVAPPESQSTPDELPRQFPVDSRLAFNGECYRQIRGEVTALLARIENLFKSTMLVAAAVFSWVLTQAFGTMQGLGWAVDGRAGAVTCVKLPQEALLIAWWIPTAFIVLSGAITLSTYLRILQMGEYLRRCEIALGFVVLSWETYIQPKPRLFFFMTLGAWVLLLAASIGVACVGAGICAPLCPPK